MRDEYSRGEFESRNRQLPADLNQFVANKANAKARADFDSAPIGSPPSCYDVRSVFDSRPVNTYDFHITDSTEYNQEVVTDVTIEMAVPEGYMAILRSIEVWFEPSSLGSERSAASLTMQLNGGDYPNNVDMLIGTATDQPIPMFLLADEFNRIGARVIQLFEGEEFYVGVVFVHFYGNFVLKSGRAYPFEVANPVLDGKCAPTRAPPQAQVLRTATPRTEPRVVAPAPRAASVPAPRATSVSAPSFAINWKLFGSGPNAMMKPFDQTALKATGKLRFLERSELQRYVSFLRASLPSRERVFFDTYLRSVGVQ